MDMRAARRAAERAARDLINDRAALVGDLAVSLAECSRLTDDVAFAHDRRRQLVAQAEAEAGALVAAARELALNGEQRYADAYSAATAAGWAADDLAALGYQPAQVTTRPRRRQPSPVHEAAVAPHRTASGVPAQAHRPDIDVVQTASTPSPT